MLTDDEKRELIANMRDYATAERASVHVHHTGADLLEQGADALEGTLPEDDEPCKAEVYSWSHFRQEMISPYWIRCTQLGTHDQHEDSRTGLKWGGV